MPKKPVYATYDELTAAKEELQAQISSLIAGKASKDENQAASVHLEPQLRELEKRVIDNANTASEASQRVASDAKSHTDHAAQVTLNEAKDIIQKLNLERNKSEAELGAKIAHVDSSLRNSFADELTALCENIDKQLNDLSSELVARIELRAKGAAEALANQRQQLDAHLDDARREASCRDSEIRSEAASELARAVGEQGKADAIRDANVFQAHTDLHTRIDNLSGTVSMHEQSAASEISGARSEALAALTSYRRANDRRLAALGDTAGMLEAALSEVRNGPTRRVEWLIRGATGAVTAEVIGDNEQAMSLWSSKFDAGGATGFQLELRIYPQEAVANEGTGNCALFLWADGGMRIAVRLYVGGKWTTLENVWNERSACGTKRLCFVKDQISSGDDSLRVGIEILELIREVEQPPLPKAESARTSDEIGMDGKNGESLFESSLVCHRHVNNRVLPQVRTEVERMQSRMVRRIEWLIEHASVLPQRFPPRQQMCSPVFSAAGVEGMQFIFYPSGYAGATDGFCSFFLYCPGGVTLRCWLSAGKQRRETHHSFGEAGAYGRTNFCRYEGLADEDTDTLLLVLEIEDCRQELTTTTVGDASGVKGEIKLARLPGKSGLTDVKLLPSLWSSKGLGDMNKPPDGYHSFGTLRSHIRSGTTALRADAGDAPEESHFKSGSSAIVARDEVLVRRSESMPALRNSPTGDNLPLLGRQPLADRPEDWNGGRARKPRVVKRPTVIVASPMHAAASN